MKRIILLIVLTCLPVSSAFCEEIRIGSGAAGIENIFKYIVDPAVNDVDLVIKVEPSGLVQAWKDLDSGKIDAAVGGLDINRWALLLQQEGYTAANNPIHANYFSQVIGRDIVKLLLNKGINIKELSKSKVKDIFTGKIKNWKEIGGPDKNIVVILPKKAQGMLTLFKEQMLEGEDYSIATVKVETAADSKEKVITTPGSISIGTFTQADNSVNSPNYPGVVRPITIIAKKPTPASIIKLEEYIKSGGQKYLMEILNK